MYKKNSYNGHWKLLFYVKFVNNILTSIFFEDYVYQTLLNTTDFLENNIDEEDDCLNEVLHTLYGAIKVDLKNKSLDCFSSAFIDNVLSSYLIAEDTKFWNEIRYKLQYRFLVDFENGFQSNFIATVNSIRHFRNNLVHCCFVSYCEEMFMFIPNWMMNDFKYCIISENDGRMPESVVNNLIEHTKQNRKNQRKLLYNKNNFIKDDNKFFALKHEHERMLNNYHSFKGCRYNYANFVMLFSLIGNQNIKSIVPKNKWAYIDFEEVHLIYNFYFEIEVLIWYFLEVVLPNDYGFYHSCEKPEDFRAMFKLIDSPDDVDQNLKKLRDTLAHRNRIKDICLELKIEDYTGFIPYATICITRFWKKHCGSSEFTVFINDLNQRILSRFNAFKIKQISENCNKSLRKVKKDDIMNFQMNDKKIIRMNFYKKYMSRLYRAYIEGLTI